MYCVIQEIELKKPSKPVHSKKLISKVMQMSIHGQDCSSYWYTYSEERFDRPIRKAYKISLHQSHRENGRVLKRQFPLCTVRYYDIADGWFNLYEYCDRKITAAAEKLGVDTDTVYDLLQAKLDPLIKRIQDEYTSTEEYKIHAEHERITKLYAANKANFTEKYGCDKNKYDEIYDVFGNLMNKDKLEDVKAEAEARKEYEEASRRYQKEFYSNYSKFYSGSGGGSYFNSIHSNHEEEDKETLKQFYRVLSKKFHPDANPGTDTSKQMQLLNQLKDEWGV